MANKLAYHRLMVIDREIRENKYPSQKYLAELLEVTPRTIARDLEYLRDSMSAPLVFDRGKRGYAYTVPHYYLPAICLTEGELLAVFIVENAFTRSLGTPLESHLRSALAKICKCLPDSITINLSELSHFCSFTPGPGYALNDSLFTCLTQAINGKKQVSMTYYTATRDAVSERTVDPLHLHNHRGIWYLIAYCHTRKEIRVFALHRIQSCRALKTKFNLPAHFDYRETLKHSLGIELNPRLTKVAILFDSYQARWIRERKWHASERQEPRPDGSLLLHLNISGLDELKRWVLSYGRHAQILKPAWLRKEMLREAGLIVKNHA